MTISPNSTQQALQVYKWPNMKGIFEILIEGKVETYYDYRDIPEVFDNVIKFMPDTPPPPHSEEDHREIQMWMERFRELLKKETNGR